MHTLKKELSELTSAKISINQLVKCDIMGAVDAAKEIAVIETKENRIKKELVLQVHVKNNGQPRELTYQKGKGLWVTNISNGHKLYAKTEADLVNKLFEHYGLALSDLSVRGVFKKALDEKERTDNNNASTIECLRCDFEKYISDDLAKRDIRTIKAADLKEYTQNLVNTRKLTKKQFFKYKAVLNLTFRYAVSPDIAIITSNPVEAIDNKKYYKNCSCVKPKSEEKILSVDEIELVKSTVRQRMAWKRHNGYFIMGYIILIAIETGMRAAELCALKWSDVTKDYIHIHAQQLSKKVKGQKGRIFYYAPWTKAEKGESKGGRKFPMTNVIWDILEELRLLQEGKGIQSEYVFCDTNGEWVKTSAYETCLRRLMQSLGFELTNNHAFRMSLNSNVFIPLGIDVAMRAKLLGHSIETNLKYYSFARIDGEKEVQALLNGQVSTRSPHFKVISADFPKKKASRMLNS